MQGPVVGARVTVLDFETTGINPHECGVVSVAVSVIDCLCKPGHPRYKEPEIVFSSLCWPGMDIPEGASRIHGITDRVLHEANAPEVEDVMDHMHREGYFEDTLIAAYNLPFDLTILRRYLPHVNKRGLDPYVWVRVVDKYEKSKKLLDVCTRRGLEFENAHDATADVIATAKLMPLLLSELKERSAIPEGTKGRINFDPKLLLDAESFWFWQVKKGRADEYNYREYCAKVGRDAPRSSPWIDGFGF
jgi:DNA polymerase III subunit epsilon